MNAINSSSREAINREAALWHARLDSGSADVNAFEAWRDSDPAHSAAFARIAATADAMNDLRGIGHSDDPDLRLTRKVDRRRLLPWAAALVAVTGGVGIWGASHARAYASTPVGGRKTVRLPDGGQLDLNTDTKVSWKFGGSSRRIWLERVEIGLSVPADHRPYLLYAAGQVMELQAGDLNARLRSTAVDVTVNKGMCTIKPQSTLNSSRGPIVVNTGQAALSAADMTHVRRLSDSDMQFTSGWRSGELIFDGQTLGVAVAEYNRYLDDKITIADPELAGIRLGGRFTTHDPKDFLASLQTSFGIHIVQLSNGSVAISR